MDFFVVEKHPNSPLFSEAARTDFTIGEAVRKGDAPRCPVCGAFVGMLESLPPIRVELETWGSEFGDCAFWLDSFLVSERFADAYRSSGLQGLTGFHQVEVLSHRTYGGVRTDPPIYFFVIPKVGSARIDAEASGVEWDSDSRSKCTNCRSGGGTLKRWKRIILDEASWQGDDIFYPYVIPGTLTVSSRFKAWADKHEFSNLILVPAIKSSHDFYPWEIAERN